jgi:outer membrane autotransporter protein
VVLESYGSTQWYSKTFTVGAAGTYKIVFGDFNAADTAVQPILIVSDISGNIVGMIVGKGAISVLNSALAVGNTPALPAAAVIDANPGLQGLFSSAGLSTDQQISDAASQTLPLLLGGLTMATRSTMDDISRVIQARMEVNRGMSSGDGFLGDKKFWLKPFGSWADQNNKDATTGFQADTAGMIIGADGTLNDRTRIGLAFAYAKSNVNSASSVAPNGADINIYQLVGYGSYNLRDDMELNFQAGFGQNINSGERDILFAGSVAKSSYNSTTADLGVGLSRRYVLNEKTTFIPTIRVDYTQIHDNAYTESGAGALNLSVDARDTEQLLLGVEGKLTRQIKTNTMLTANLGLGYDVIHDLNRTTAYFAGAPGTAFAADGVQPARWTGRVGIGLVHTLASGMEISARYDYEGDYHFTNNTVSAKARWSF